MITWNAQSILALVAACIAAYLLGSINFAIIVTKIFTKQDIRDYGSGNAGMTNVLRITGKVPAILTFLGDALKGVVAIFLARILFFYLAGTSDFLIGEFLAALCALLGHVFPVFHEFRGGKGIVVSAGVLLALNPWYFVCVLSAFLIVFVITQTISISSIAAAAVCPISVFCLHMAKGLPDAGWALLFSLLIAVLVIWMHRSNIGRILRGEEPKIGQKKR